MTLIHHACPARTLETLADLGDGPFEIWCFDDRASRETAQNALAARGITARIRSAYKPLLQAFLEEIPSQGLTAVQITYPVHPAADSARFRLEAYPLIGMLNGVDIRMQAGDSRLTYRLVLTYGDRQETRLVRAPNRLHTSVAGLPALSPTGWQCSPDRDQRIETDYEKLFEGAMDAIARYDWGKDEPYFDQLVFDVTLPIRDEPLPYADEVLSLAEALHEDLYFSALEFFQHLSGRPLGDRGLQPGQIVPVIRYGDSPSVSLSTRGFLPDNDERPDTRQRLDDAAGPLVPSRIASELARIGGVSFAARTRTGRTVQARHVDGNGAPIMISAGQHANETTGVVGALRAGQRLAEQGAAFTLSPLENPDGYALHQTLIGQNPRHMHHAARYTALGDDLEYREEPGVLYEKSIRHQAEARTQAQLHLNLHGYPSHEWTRPLSGYVPRNFAMWTLPKGFFLILRHHPDWEPQARALVDAVTRHLAALPGVLDENARQIALYQAHAGETGFEMINGFPCLISTDDRHRVPVTLITEYPDETIYGPAFIRGQTVQMETILAAHAAWQSIQTGV